MTPEGLLGKHGYGKLTVPKLQNNSGIVHTANNLFFGICWRLPETSGFGRPR